MNEGVSAGDYWNKGGSYKVEGVLPPEKDDKPTKIINGRSDAIYTCLFCKRQFLVSVPEKCPSCGERRK